MDDEEGEEGVEALESRSETIEVGVVDLLVGDFGGWMRFSWGGTREDGDVVLAGGDCGFKQVGCDVFGSVSKGLYRQVHSRG